MPRCTSCGGAIADGKRFCGECGAAADRTSAPTETCLLGDSAIASHPSLDRARFIPGTVVAKRYRIVALLGRGGMGEVYRADDLKLGQAVALKFLPEALQRDVGRRERFLNEVKVALKVTHPNVCRVYDVGEVEGHPYISMEYVDGENLASLLRRIGRLPGEKALDISRQLCAGLAAAHDVGIVHRDLKPANVMLDGRGRARITDFGLAAAAEAVRGPEARAGTPAYMAPEQIEGKEATPRSDMYALGLVLYELFTGKRAFEAATVAELRRLHVESTPTSPSAHVEIDPSVERAILRCLEKDPAARPRSTVAVAAMLPRGDPLAAAIAAGETPSPEMVAAAGASEGLRPAVAWACLAATAAAGLLAIVLGAPTKAWVRANLEKSPAVLADHARTILHDLGYPEPPGDSAWAFGMTWGYFDYVQLHDRTAIRWGDVDRAVRFWYRESPSDLVSSRFFVDVPAMGPTRVTFSDPPRTDTVGMASVLLDPRGRLQYLLVVPPFEDEQQSTPVPDWTALFSAAGLDPVGFTPIASRWTPPVFADERAAWEGTAPGLPGRPLRIEAAAFRGRPVYFELVYPWVRHEQSAGILPPGPRVAWVIYVGFWITLIAGGALLARRNIRLGRGDRRGATRLSAAVFLLMATTWVVAADHIATVEEFDLCVIGLSWSLFGAAVAWLLYLAVEPIVRRRWPLTLVSWSRLLRGSVRDPLVGRHVLVGCLAGAVVALAYVVSHLARPTFTAIPPVPLTTIPPPSGAVLCARVLGELNLSVFMGLGFLFLLVVLRALFRSHWVAAAVVVLVFATIEGALGESRILDGVMGGLPTLTTVLLLTRFGLLSSIACQYFALMLIAAPIAPHSAPWNAGQGFVLLLFLASIVLLAFRTSLSGRFTGSSSSTL
jgi:serine/threonine-protein kinase